MRAYLRYIGPALWTWAKGIRWLWTRDLNKVRKVFADIENFVPVEQNWITYKPGWGPLYPRPFLLVYLTTYLAGTIAGYGVVSLSRAWYDRSCICAYANIIPGHCAMKPHYFSPAHPFARFMTRLLDWAFPRSAHGRHTGPRLWGVQGIR